MKTLKNVLALALVGAFVGSTVATLIAPKIIAWYQTPGTLLTAMCPCADLARQISSQLVSAQLSGAAVGAVAFIIVGALVRSARARKTAAPTSQTPSHP